MESQHQEAIENFCAITGSWDIEIAIAYLSYHNWDLSEASSEFLGFQRSPIAVTEYTGFVTKNEYVPAVHKEPERSTNPVSQFFSWIGDLFSSTYRNFCPCRTSQSFYFSCAKLKYSVSSSAHCIQYRGCNQICCRKKQIVTS